MGDAAEAHRQSCANGAISAAEPSTLVDEATGQSVTTAEIVAYGDVVIRFVSGAFAGSFLPNYTPVEATRPTFGLQRLDHAVGNVPDLFKATDYLMRATGVSSPPGLLWDWPGCCGAGPAAAAAPLAWREATAHGLMASGA